MAGVADCTATVQQYGMTDDLTSQLSTGLTIKIYGTDAETLTALSEKVVDIVNNTEGFQNATNGLGAGDSTIILQVDRDKVRANGLTVRAGVPADRCKADHHHHGTDPCYRGRHHHGCADQQQSGPADQGKHDGHDL